MLRKALLILIIATISVQIHAQQSSVLATGKWVKMSFESPGVYKIDFKLLTEMGFSPSQIDPKNLAIYGNQGGMLPQANSAYRPSDLEEIAIWVEGENDNVFNDGDYLLFYVDMVDKLHFDANSKQFNVEKNLYTQDIFYFLTEKESEGKRIQDNPNLGTDYPAYNWHNSLVDHEQDLINLLQSGREWFGENLGAQTSRTFPIDNALLVSGTLKLQLTAIAQSYGTSSLSVRLGEANVGSLEFDAIPNTQYGIKANEQTFKGEVALNGNESSLDLQLDYDKNGASNAIAYLDKFLVDIPTRNTFSQEQLSFRNSESIDNGLSTFQVETDNQNAMVWNITEHGNSLNQSFERAENNITFGDFSSTLQSYVIFDPANLPAPLTYEIQENQDLRSMLNTELLIISHENFLTQAQRIAQFRSVNNGINSTIVTPEEIYNEFSSGRPDVTAIRDYIRHLYANGSLKYVLLFGKGSYDYQNKVTDNSNFVPTYESRNSIHPLLTYSSDDYFGFMEESEGEWAESTAGDHTLEISIGRIPITDINQAKFFVDKWINYQTNPETKGTWRQEVVFVADDGDGNLHSRDADFLAGLVEDDFIDFQVNKLYLDSYFQEQLPNGEKSPDAEQALLEAVNNGSLVINFTGHGAESGWMQERILTFDLMNQWTNPNKLPFLVTATCEFGRNDDPQVFSGAENLLFKEIGGAIGLVTTARPVFSSSNFSLNQAIYAKMFKKENGRYPTLGEIIQYTKNNSLEGSLNRNFILLGDPSMTLAYPNKEVQLTSVNGINIETQLDTLSAFEQVMFTGEIQQQSMIDYQFNGTLYYQLLDKPQPQQTLGNGNPQFNFSEQNHTLFKGSASITNGQFQASFVVPKNIDYQYGKGKIRFYAVSNNQSEDAIGGSKDIIIGGTGTNVTTDLTPPSIELALNDFEAPYQTSYQGNVLLLARLSDESGINISNLGFGQNINLTINDSASYTLNDYFISEKDDFSRGTISFPLNNLAPGANIVNLKAWDNFGNSNTASIEVIIKENSSAITEIKNYPNPLESETHFLIEHTLIGENVDVKIEILTLNGQPVTAFGESFINAERVLSVPWTSVNNQGTQLEKGLYIYNVHIRSNTTEKAGSMRKKLVISY
ncbi:type IX secretion system sortase PorU [Roseivirga pacifica]|uniref:type IX secretion system sortase PorU n=1 Tax=Roseivirga pacifica TaxID=1267423 RepID=UPI002094607E|nr:type IX secretion system sortase PorU [Roseivirga pacifica]MCO6357894.1 type IX secretion system sortase PorU [Roseivirga pacifica]MCO6366146.1 type IX secretion system sortase PorU [Roseivirga pacifica]MCO6371474.1 type IX secretion system sortase PorU [Roseivirga pacifica]MCO6375354.1 type IX secretion system sortase PorU [Roseivirga pacifica]MCO6378852.1 type IX secretion system sortase PorU [Roseivirga pacifica]